MAFMIPAVRNEYDIYLSRSPRNSGSPPTQEWSTSSVEEYLRSMRGSACQNNNNVFVKNNNLGSSRDRSSGSSSPQRKTSRDIVSMQARADPVLIEKLKKCDPS
ncbi:hypothetical protein HPB49_016310 [Dermacentor silvarum]|uniref:Uncharacterized protein n=1 Tax=Dermacentor silvarum TaxID=543639 RepID=A0ACB8CM10_DERSI|nr:uncharacterized protein LOC119456130 [Dermacentor silvarum]KAH7945840.1 hypothetical protein HPB49_016310 [Dermacentor silvarum]